MWGRGHILYNVELTYARQRNGNIDGAQAAGRGVKRTRNSADLAAPGESVVRHFLQRSRALDVPIVLASRREEDRRALASLLAGSAWRLVEVNTPEGALAELRQAKIPIVLCDPDIGGDRWETVVRSFLKVRRGARVLLLVDRFDGFSRAEGSRGFDFLIRPLDRDHLFAALFFAYARCKTASSAVWLIRSHNP